MSRKDMPSGVALLAVGGEATASCGNSRADGVKIRRKVVIKIIQEGNRSDLDKCVRALECHFGIKEET